MPEAKSLIDLMRIRSYNQDILENVNSTLGTALGLKKPTDGELTDAPAILVFVPFKVNPKWIPSGQLLPEKLEGPNGLWCFVDVVEGERSETETIRAIQKSSSYLAERLRGWDDKIWCGSQISSTY